MDIPHHLGDLIREGETICKITNPFQRDTTSVPAPFTGLLVGMLENPVVYPGNPLCHFVRVPEPIQTIIERGGDPDSSILSRRDA